MQWKLNVIWLVSDKFYSFPFNELYLQKTYCCAYLVRRLCFNLIEAVSCLFFIEDNQ